MEYILITNPPPLTSNTHSNLSHLFFASLTDHLTFLTLSTSFGVESELYVPFLLLMMVSWFFVGSTLLLISIITMRTSPLRHRSSARGLLFI